MRIWEGKIYLARHLGLSLKELGQVPALDLLAMVREVEYQRRVEQYPLLRTLGQVVCGLYGDKMHQYKPQDIIGDEPKREARRKMTKKDNYDVVLGDGETYTLSVLNANMIEAIEDEFDKTWAELFGPNCRVKVIKSMVWQMLLPNYSDMTKEKVGKLITAKVIPALVAIMNGMSDG